MIAVTEFKYVDVYCINDFAQNIVNILNDMSLYTKMSYEYIIILGLYNVMESFPNNIDILIEYINSVISINPDSIYFLNEILRLVKCNYFYNINKNGDTYDRYDYYHSIRHSSEYNTTFPDEFYERLQCKLDKINLLL